MRLINVFYSVLICALVEGQVPECSEGDMHYTYTECDTDKSRWRVSVPKSGIQCRVTSPKPPVQGPPCDKSCDAGKYLDVDGEQDCVECPVGTYSVGNGVRYDLWDELPKGFTVSDNPALQFVRGHSTQCTNSTHQTWVAQGSYLEGVPSECNTDLSITAELITAGSLKVIYHNSLTMMGFVQVKSMCEQNTGSTIISDLAGITALSQSKDSDYDTAEVKMSPGKNKITFSLLGMRTAAPGNKFIIQSIEIKGMGFSTECTPCRPGFYSSSGASHCTRCNANTYSPTTKSASCKDCKENEFSPPGAKECKLRPPCTTSDYYASIAPCTNGTTHETYEWLDNMYCNVKDTHSVKLPPPGESKACPPCNPGQQLNAHGVCKYCKEGEASDGSTSCEPCPIGSEARKSLTFTHFDAMPENLYPGCIKISAGGSFCDKQSTWVPKGSYIQVSDDIHPADFAVLNINGSRFSNVTLDGRVYGSLVIKFDLTCDHSDGCLLYLMQEDTDLRVIKSWNTTTSTVYQHNFTTNDITLISIAFRKSSDRMRLSSTNTLKISELRLINTVAGGATECTKCMLDDTTSADKGCHRCSTGEVVVINNVTNKKTCEKCPANHIAADSYTCLPCGKGLVNNADHTMCISDCQLSSDDGMKFNLSPFSGINYYNGTPMFTIKGTPYFSGINFTLCSLDLSAITKPKCGQSSKADHKLNLISGKNEVDIVSSLVCRETVLPAESTLSIQPSSLGDTLNNITINDGRERKKLMKGGIQIDDDELSIHYNYVTSYPTEKCAAGLTTVITLICDTREAGEGTKLLPPKCYGGTCDGCSYHMTWRTELACPKCEEADYKKIVGECVSGEQTVTYIPQNKFCPMTEEIRNRESTQECTLLTLTIKIALAVIAVVVLLLFACAIYCWKRSRKLEYKYMRLVEGAQGNPGELPAAQTCAWSDGEEEDEDDRVAFKTKGDRLFGKLGSKKDKSDGFEKLKLVGNSLPEI